MKTGSIKEIFEKIALFGRTANAANRRSPILQFLDRFMWLFLLLATISSLFLLRKYFPAEFFRLTRFFDEIVAFLNDQLPSNDKFSDAAKSKFATKVLLTLIAGFGGKLFILKWSDSLKWNSNTVIFERYVLAVLMIGLAFVVPVYALGEVYVNAMNNNNYWMTLFKYLTLDNLFALLNLPKAFVFDIAISSRMHTRIAAIFLIFVAWVQAGTLLAIRDYILPDDNFLNSHPYLKKIAHYAIKEYPHWACSFWLNAEAHYTTTTDAFYASSRASFALAINYFSPYLGVGTAVLNWVLPNPAAKL